MSGPIWFWVITAIVALGAYFYYEDQNGGGFA